MTGTRMSREEQRAQTRRELLDAAAEVFAQKGYHAASVDDVAEAAGFTKGAVYSNFDSKEQLFLALYREHTERAVALGERVLDAPPEDRGAALADSREDMGVWEHDWHLLETEFLLYAARNETMRALVAEQHQRTREQVAAIVQTHLDDVGADDVEAMAIARLIIGALDGMATTALIEGVDHGHLVGTMIDLMTRGLAVNALAREERSA